MSTLEQLKSAKSLGDLAEMLGYTPKGLSYVLYIRYKIDPKEKYRTFEISKKSGGTRTIQAPEKEIMLLQKHLAKMLYKCIDELICKYPRF